MEKPSEPKVEHRFYVAQRIDDDHEQPQNICRDCGGGVLAADNEDRIALCEICYTRRAQLIRTASQKGFRLGL